MYIHAFTHTKHIHYYVMLFIYAYIACIYCAICIIYICVYMCACLLSFFSPVQLFATLWTVACQDCNPPGSSVQDSPGKNTAMGCHALLQGIFLTQGSNPVSLMSPVLAGRFFTTSASGKPHMYTYTSIYSYSSTEILSIYDDDPGN